MLAVYMLQRMQCHSGSVGCFTLAISHCARYQVAVSTYHRMVEVRMGTQKVPTDSNGVILQFTSILNMERPRHLLIHLSKSMQSMQRHEFYELQCHFCVKL